MTQANRHAFVAIDEGLGTLLHVDQSDGRKNWVVTLGQPQARDMQLVGQNRVLIGHDHGYTEYDLATGRRVKEVGWFHGVTSVRRLPKGHTRLAGVNLLGATGVVLAELDEWDRVVQTRTLAGDYVRLIRETGAGSFLMMCNTRIRETDLTGTTIRELPVDGFLHAWKAVRRRDGNVIAWPAMERFWWSSIPRARFCGKLGPRSRCQPR